MYEDEKRAEKQRDDVSLPYLWLVERDAFHQGVVSVQRRYDPKGSMGIHKKTSH
jgi:hypothetical protein